MPAADLDPVARPGPVPRRHQRLALDAVRRAWEQGRERAWVVLPPGAGKTLVGLWAAAELRSRAAGAPARRVVVLGPNTAIQGQWVKQAHGLTRAGTDLGTVSTGRDLAADLTSLTYQSLAVFDPDAEVDDDGAGEPAEERVGEGGREDGTSPLLSRLHENGRELVSRLQAAGPLLLVLDECHHLLQVWGQLLAELLTALPDARVLGLTATPPGTLTRVEAELVDTLFGETVFEASIPALVREGDLAPFAELAWLTTPTPTEQRWLDQGAERFAELCSYLTDPAHGSLSFLSWLDARLLTPVRQRRATWEELVAAQPELCDAGLRMHRAGLLDLPPGARPREQHRRAPDADDWLRLAQDWVDGHLRASGDPADAEVVQRIRAALPGIGFRWTRHGIRPGRSPVDRVLARSRAKAVAAVEVVAHEAAGLGPRLRALALCDHERATATLPSVLDGVLDPGDGSALATLVALLEDPRTAACSPVLVTGSTVAGARDTMRALAEQVRQGGAPRSGWPLEVVPRDGVWVLQGPWRSRDWVPQVTEFFAAGRCRVLVGTRALLGEGWDAPGISTLVDLTTATTATAVVQTRGRALRTDPGWRDKVALTWSVVCLAGTHPRGDADWRRLVRKHEGFWGVDDEGEVVTGVGHLHPGLSPWRPPAETELDALNATMLLRAEDRAGVRERWRVGEPYADRVGHSVRVLEVRGRLSTVDVPVAVTAGPGGRLQPWSEPVGWRPAPSALVLLALALVAAGAAVAAPPGVLTATLVGAAAALAVAAVLAQLRRWRDRGTALLARAVAPPSLQQVARAVADGLHAADLAPVGATAVRVRTGAAGEYRCQLDGVSEEVSATFADALEEAMAPLTTPRYLLSRRSPAVPVDRTPAPVTAVAAGCGRRLPQVESWHPVPAVLGVNAARAGGYARAWERWVGSGRLLWTGSPDGAGVLAAQQGTDPFDVTAALRVTWQ